MLIRTASRFTFLYVPVLVPLLVAGVLSTGCQSRSGASPSTPGERSAGSTAGSDEPEDLEAARDILRDLRAENRDLRAENRELRARMREYEIELASTTESQRLLERELASAIEELTSADGGRSRPLDSRPMAVSRIAEVRVELQSVPEADHPEVALRLQRAAAYLDRADVALEAGNHQGAGYLAERGHALVRQAAMVGEILASSGDIADTVIPFVPPHTVEVAVNANLRSGPGVEFERIGGVERGRSLEVVAQWGDWYQVRTASGLTGWVLRELVR